MQAGEFEALKIEVIGYYHGEQVGSNGGGVQLNETLWYAPSVNNFVKLEYQDTDWNGPTCNHDLWGLASYTHC